MEPLFLTSVLVGIVCAGSVIVSVVILARRPAPPSELPDATNRYLVFEDDRLVDADDAIWPLLPNVSATPRWSEVRLALFPFVADIPETLDHFCTKSGDSGIQMTIQQVGNRSRLTLSPNSDRQADWFQVKQDEIALSQMRPALVHAPDPVWSVDHNGNFIWGNEAFARYAAAYGGASAFADHVSKELVQPDLLRSRRLKLDAPGLGHSVERWLEVTTKETDTGALFYATGIDAVVRAEDAQRNFVQTLSKTFANLTTGLAIFDRDRRLALFNPALIDLSGVSVEFLSSRPALFEFFDKLREKQIMPEPKCYDDWRERMAMLVAAASDDRFRETWNLASGQTLDVTGRPYPDGAIAFLFNDITAEVSLTRGFRTELETMQSMLDIIEDAVSVFDHQGVLMVCNAAYKKMWKVDPDTCVAESTILDATLEWKSAFHPAPVWSELRDYVTATSERASWDSELRGKDGREVVCRIDPICYGATMIRFCHAPRRKDTSPEKDGLQVVSA